MVVNLFDHGCIRMLESTRKHQENIIPHSHRSSLHSIVLEGSVTNITWQDVGDEVAYADKYVATQIQYVGGKKRYERVTSSISHWMPTKRVYTVGEDYFMESDTVHSIEFSRDAKVLIFESAQKSPTSIILEPYVYDKQHVQTLEVKPWMFQDHI